MTKEKDHDPFEAVDFEEWARLAASDPVAFEKKRSALLRRVINAQTRNDPLQRRRLKALQWRIDRERERAGSPLASCMTLSRMMLDSVFEEGGLRDALQGRSVRERLLGDSGKVIPFPNSGSYKQKNQPQ